MHFSCSSRLLLATSSLSVLSIALAVPAHAQLTLTLDQPNQFYNTSSGGELIVFNGTIQNNTLDTQSINDTAVLFPYTAAGQPLSNQNGSGTIFGFTQSPPSTFAPGDSFSGTLFYASLDATTLPGVYDLGIGGDSKPDVPSTFEVQEHDSATGAFYNVAAPYSITVTSPAAVPEASTTVSLGLLLALGLGGLGIAKRKKASAGAA